MKAIGIKENKSNLKSSYRPEIDGLRAFATIMVIINHFNKNILPNGYLGVDIFFVISGFVITSSLYQKPSKNFKNFIIRFYERRIKRLLPALSVCVLITSIAICLFNPQPGLSLKTGLSSLFGLSNLYLFTNSIDYFAQSTELNVFLHTWSLGVEEQFYIIFPFLIWFSGFGRQTVNGSRNLVLTVGGLTVTSLISFLYLYPTNQPAAYFLMTSRFWEISAGCLLFITLQNFVSIKHLLEKFPPLLVLGSILGIMFLPVSLAIISTVAVIVLSAIQIACLKKENTIAFKIFTQPRIVYIGQISYSLYLWHWGVITISRWTIGIYWWTVPFQIAMIFILAVSSYKYIETPFRKYNWFEKEWKTIIVSGGLLVTLSTGLIALGKPLKGNLYIGKHSAKDFVYVQDRMECELAINKSIKNPLSCLTGDPSKKTIYIFGNSHASNLVPSVQFAALSNDFDEVKYLTNAFARRMGGKHWSENREVHKILDKTTTKDLIIWSHSYISPKDQKAKIYITSEIQYLSRLSNKTGVKILIVDGLPNFGDKQNFLRKLSIQQNGPVLKEANVREDRKFHTELIKSVIKSPNIFYLDPLQVLCREGICESVIDDKLIYADSTPHFNKEGAYVLSSLLSKTMSRINK